MQIHPLVPMRKAATLLGVEKDQLKAKLVSGEIRGEQRRVGSKDKWFVYAGEVSNRIDTERLPELMKRTDGQLALEVETVLETDSATLENLDTFFEEAHEELATTVQDIQVTQAFAATQSKGMDAIDGLDEIAEIGEVKAGLPATTEFNHIFESLTVVFAQRLSDEYQKVLIAEQKIKIAETRVKAAEQKTKAYEENIKRLEVQRDEAQYLVDERNSIIAEMEAQVRELQQQLNAKASTNKPSFWQKFFGI